MRVTRKQLKAGAAGVGAALLLLLAACGEPSDQSSSDQGAVAPAAGNSEPAPAAPATEGNTTTKQ